jgi:1-aminocyclopropane-1-carboxylate synthase
MFATGNASQLSSLHIIRFFESNYLHSNAGFFLWIDLSPYLSPRNPDSASWAAEKELKTRLSEAGVEISPGLGNKAERPGWFRVIFSVERDILEEGLRR